MWFVTKAQPWGALALFGLLAVAWLPRLRRSAGPAALYLAIVLIGLSLPAAKRMDYLLPAFAPASVLVVLLLRDVVRNRVLTAVAIVAVAAVGALLVVKIGLALAAHQGVAAGVHPADVTLPGLTLLAAIACGLIERRRAVPLAAVAIVPLLLTAALVMAFRTKFLEVGPRWSDHAVAFVRDIRRQVGDNRNLLVIVRGKHPLTTLLGHHQGSYLMPIDLQAADFVVMPEQPDLPALAISEPLPEGFAELENRPLARLGLYRHVPPDRLIAAQKACGEWTTVENPYHEAGTVFRAD